MPALVQAKAWATPRGRANKQKDEAAPMLRPGEALLQVRAGSGTHDQRLGIRHARRPGVPAQPAHQAGSTRYEFHLANFTSIEVVDPWLHVSFSPLQDI